MSIMPQTSDSKSNPPPECHADRDGDCSWTRCPQVNDYQSGRHCPLDVGYDDWNEPEEHDLARQDAYLAKHPLSGDA